ncbi:MAG: Na+/H+ antiporter [Cyanobacteria bacterium DS2.3.42]|nr:Na+/H+ antiporter [Cyanobacteria bacterium DS2.3.42]
MEPHHTLPIDILVVLLLVASAVAIAVKWVRVPYSIALVIVGLTIGVCQVLPSVEMTPELILLVFLPALLFEASWNIHLDELKANWVSITVLATVGVLVSMTVVGAIMHAYAGMTLITAFLFGALISATDPISVLALFRKIGIDKRLTMILEGESIFNDGTAAVLFTLILSMALSQSELSASSTIGRFGVEVVGGAVVGSALGMAASTITRFFDDHLLEITLTTILAYGSFLVAMQMHVSPVLSVVTAGIVMGNFGGRKGMSATTRLAVNSFWEYAAFVVNSLVFLFIGLQVKVDLLIKYGHEIGIAIIAILIARIPVAYLLTSFCSTKNRPIPFNWKHILYWGSLRGSLCMALALSIPLGFPNKEQFIITTFGVVLFTLLVQGLTIEPLVRILGIRPENQKYKQYQMLKSRLIAESEAISALKSLKKLGHISQGIFSELESEIVESQRKLQNELEDLHLEDASVKELEMTSARLHILDIKRDVIKQLVRQGKISEEIAEEIQAEVDGSVFEIVAQEEETKEGTKPALKQTLNKESKTAISNNPETASTAKRDD